MKVTHPDGTRYRVDEPELLLWVHCGEVASCADIGRRSGLPFSASDLDVFVDEQHASTELIGLDRAATPLRWPNSTPTTRRSGRGCTRVSRREQRYG